MAPAGRTLTVVTGRPTAFADPRVRRLVRAAAPGSDPRAAEGGRDRVGRGRRPARCGTVDATRSVGRRARERHPRHRAAAVGGGAGRRSACGALRVDRSAAARAPGLRTRRGPPGRATRREACRPGRAAGVRVVVHESRRHLADDVVRRTGHPPVHRPARAVVDAAAWGPSDRAAAGVLTAAVQQRLVTPAGVRAELDRAGRVRRAGLVRQLLEDVAGGVEALSELDFALLCRRAGLPEPKRQRCGATRRGGAATSTWSGCERGTGVAWWSRSTAAVTCARTSGRTTCSRPTTSPSTTTRSSCASPG